MERTEIKINETIVTCRKFISLIDKETNTWEMFCGWAVTNRPFRRSTPKNNLCRVSVSPKERLIAYHFR